MAHASGNPTWEDYPDLSTLVTATSLENIENALDLAHNPPVCELTLTTTYTGLTGPGSYLMSGNMTATVDPLSMFSKVTENRITIPVAGRYQCDWVINGSTSMVCEADILKNPPPGTAAATARSTYGVFHDAQAATGDVAFAHASGNEVFAAGNYLVLGFFFNTTSDLRTVGYGGVKTKAVVRYIGPT